MQRYSCSRPIAIALADGVVSKETSVFDYGCGRGGDLQYLRKQRIVAQGWDPHFRPDEPLKKAHVVNLGFVINVIEDPVERAEALRKAFSLAEDVLVVSVRVDQVPEGSVEFADGHLTAKGTFQKIFTQAGFREYVEDILGRRAHMASLGVAYVFNNDEREAQFIANRTFTRRLEYRTDLIEQFAKNPVARRFVRLGTKLGRLPSPSEFRDHGKLVDLFGSDHRIERLFLRQVDRQAFDGSRAERREDLLTYIASLYLEGVRPPPLGALPEPQHDVRATVGLTTRVALDHLAQLLAGAGDGLVVGGDARFLHGRRADQQGQRLLQGQSRRLPQSADRVGTNARVRAAALNPQCQILAGIAVGHAHLTQAVDVVAKFLGRGADGRGRLGHQHTFVPLLRQVRHHEQSAPQPLLPLFHGVPPSARHAVATAPAISRTRARNSGGATTFMLPAASSTRVTM
jgi:DNA phosphorothioation-associated putative methyltransferase